MTFHPSRMFLVGVMAMSLMAWLCPNRADADLYVGGAQSLEWLVDSSDEIFSVRLDAVDGAIEGFTLRVLEPLKGNFSASELQLVVQKTPEAVFRLEPSTAPQGTDRIQFCMGGDRPHWSAACEAISADEWFLFVRRDNERLSSMRIFYAMNLNRPREFHSVAAILASGEAIAKKEDVVAAVRARVALKRKLPEGCQRYLIDRWSKDKGIDKWALETKDKEWFWSSAEVASISGGFAISISNSYWDSPGNGDNNEDLWLSEAIVPATLDFFPILVKQIESQKSPRECDVYALLNYPGEKTESLLGELIRRKSMASRIADRVLTHLRYRENFGDPLNKKLIGRWNLYGNSERVELNLREDQSCTIDTIPLRSGNSTPRPLQGRGYWAVRDGHLWISRSHIRKGDDWAQALREFFPLKTIVHRGDPKVVRNGGPKKILSSDDQSVVLEGGPRMARP